MEITAEKKYPYIEYEDTEVFKKVVKDFEDIITKAVNDVKSTYDTLKLDQPLDTETWHSLAEKGVSIIYDRINDKLAKIKDFLGVTEGIVKSNIINVDYSPAEKIRQRLDFLNYTLNGSINSARFSSFNLTDVNIENDPVRAKVRNDVLEERIRDYQYVINNPDEERIKAALLSHAQSYNELVAALGSFGYTHLPNGYNNPLAHIYRFNEDKSIEVKPGAASFVYRTGKKSQLKPSE